MRIVGLGLAGLGGVLVGALGTAFAFNLLPLPDGVRSPLPLARLEALPTKALGEELLGRVAGKFVADNRDRGGLEYGVGFYDQPTAYGDHLCMVRVYGVPGQVVNGEPEDRGIGSLSVTEGYGIWRDPSAPTTVDPARQEACAHYRDFEHLVWGDAALRGTFMMDAARDAAVAGKVDFKVTCVDYGHGPDAETCDGLALIRAIDLRKIGAAEPISRTEAADEKSAVQIDEIRVRLADVSGHPAEQTFRITSRQRYGREDADRGVVEAVAIRLDVF